MIDQVKTISIIFLLTLSNSLLAQSPLKKALMPWRVSIGGQWQGAITENLINVNNIIPTYVPPLCGGGPCIPYNYERNVQGIGLTAGLGLRARSFEFHYSPVFRYDQISIDFPAGQTEQRSEFFIHHRLGINKFFRGKNKQPNQYVGFSYMWLNTGKKLDFYDNLRKEMATLELQFPAITAAYGRSIYKQLFGEFQVYYLYKGVPINHTRHFFMYGLSVYYNFGFSLKSMLGKKDITKTGQ